MTTKTNAIPNEGRRSMYGGIGARLSQTTTAMGAPMTDKSALSSKEIDLKCRIVLAEITRCKQLAHQYIESSVLHNVPQTFVPAELCIELEGELDRLLTEQILREERQQAIIATTDPSAAPGDANEKNEHQLDNEKFTSNADDPELCLACDGHCKWTPFCNANALSTRRKALYSELKSAEKSIAKTIQSVVARSTMNGGETNFIRTQLIKELSAEIVKIDSKLKLAQIDDELHRTYASKEAKVSIRSIHGYDTTVTRQDAIWALDREHNRHVAKMMASETIDNILEFMLDGWFFGERDTKAKKQLEELPSFDQRGTFIEKASGVQVESNADALREANANANNEEDLKTVETTMKYRLFCLTFMYFRMLHVLRKEKSNWDGSNDLVSMKDGPPLSEERKKIIQEEKNAKFRQRRIDLAMNKARVGEERKRKRLEKERLEKIKIKEWETRKKMAQQQLATTVQRVYRGHLGRKIAKVRAAKQEREDYAEALANDCATDIARVWRGYCGRIDAGFLRAEMAKFLFQIREEEARDEEMEYLATHNRFQRAKKERRNS